MAFLAAGTEVGLAGPGGLRAGARVPARPSTRPRARRRLSSAPRASVLGPGGRRCARVRGTGGLRGRLCWGRVRRGSGASAEHRGSGAGGAAACCALHPFPALKPRLLACEPCTRISWVHVILLGIIVIFFLSKDYAPPKHDALDIISVYYCGLNL